MKKNEKEIGTKTNNSKPEKSAVKCLLGKNIRQIRKSKNLSQEQLAFKLGTSPKHLGYIENGDSFISADLLEKISACLETPVHMLFYDAKSSEPTEESELKRQSLISEMESIVDSEILQAHENIKNRIKCLK